jgi:low temperature requirement protein LtrA
VEPEARDEHQVTSLGLFFDLAFVFAVTQVTRLLSETPTWTGVLHGALVLAAVWWAWIGYAWLTSAIDVDEGGVRLSMLGAMAGMLGLALAVPGAFGRDAALFGAAYLLVTVLHLALSCILSRDDPDRRSALVRFAPTSIIAAALLLMAGVLDHDVRLVVWVLALAIAYLGPTVIGMGQGWHVAPAHYAERYGSHSSTGRPAISFAGAPWGLPS